MAIINVTPDSFSDGGAFLDPGAAVTHALRAIDEGASMLDIGGESTRPGAAAVSAEEQCRRVVPVIRALREQRAADDALISVDTTNARVASAALDAGADLVNDTSAGADDPAMLPLVASRGCGLVLMHRRRLPAQEVWSDQVAQEHRTAGKRTEFGRGVVDDAATIEPIGIVERVRRDLESRVRAGIAAGVERDRIALDPGLGFGKSVEENFELLVRSDALSALGHAVVIGASRKSFIGAATGVREPAARLAGSLAAALAAASSGAGVLRVHDVGPHREALAVLRCASRNEPGDA